MIEPRMYVFKINKSNNITKLFNLTMEMKETLFDLGFETIFRSDTKIVIGNVYLNIWLEEVDPRNLVHLEIFPAKTDFGQGRFHLRGLETVVGQFLKIRIPQVELYSEENDFYVYRPVDGTQEIEVRTYATGESKLNSHYYSPWHNSRSTLYD
jgi:hypothetical protein